MKSNNMIMRTSSGVTLLPAELKLFSDERKIYLTGEINDEMMISFSQKIQVLLADDKQSPITIYIDSVGGEIRAGLAIYNILSSLSSKIEINMYCLSKALSMAAVLVASGKPGNRFLLPYSEIMIHEPLVISKTRTNGSASTMRSMADSLESSKAIIDGLLAKHTGKNIEEIAEATSYDNYMTAEEAVEFGIADKIVDFTEII